MTIPVKTCSQCKDDKFLREFGTTDDGLGIKAVCKSCEILNTEALEKLEAESKERAKAMVDTQIKLRQEIHEKMIEAVTDRVKSIGDPYLLEAAYDIVETQAKIQKLQIDLKDARRRYKERGQVIGVRVPRLPEDASELLVDALKTITYKTVTEEYLHAHEIGGAVLKSWHALHPVESKALEVLRKTLAVRKSQFKSKVSKGDWTEKVEEFTLEDILRYHGGKCYWEAESYFTFLEENLVLACAVPPRDAGRFTLKTTIICHKECRTYY